MFLLTPPLRLEDHFLLAVAGVYYIITQSFYISKIYFVYLRMETWVIGVQSRIPVGIALGWSFFDKDENHDYGELIIYLALISLHLKWQ